MLRKNWDLSRNSRIYLADPLKQAAESGSRNCIDHTAVFNDIVYITLPLFPHGWVMIRAEPLAFIK